MKIFLLLILTLSTYASFFPKNDLRLPVAENEDNKYETLIINFSNFILEKNIITRIDWLNEGVNAYASIENGQKYITLLGGLLRHPTFNENILSLILCHEVGHHFGGTPYKKDDNGEDRWSSVEGKSDYYASNLCLKEFYSAFQPTIKIPNKDVKNYCLQFESKSTDYNFCISLVSSALDTARFAYKISGTRRGSRLIFPNINKKDSSIVSKTIETHPSPQCRLDTFLIASLVNEDNEKNYPHCWFYQ